MNETETTTDWPVASVAPDNASQRSADDTFDLQSNIKIRPVTPLVGAIIDNIDLSRPLPPPAVADIKQALGHYGVVFFENQTLSPEQHLSVAESFGIINVNRFFKALDDWPGIAEVRKEPDQRKNIGPLWHADHSYDEIPAMGSILKAVELPDVGGDTMFASMTGAFAGLSDGLKALILPLRAWHSSRHVFGKSAGKMESRQDGRINNPDAASQDACHPLVISHPFSGKPCLYVNPQFTVCIDGWTETESKALLDVLYDAAIRPENVCRYRWRNGSVAFWDNRASWHMALNDYHGHRRLMHRITIEGTSLLAVNP